MSAQEALERLGQSSAEACLGVLEMFAPGKCSAGDVTGLRRRQVGVLRHAGAGGGDVGLLRRRRHRRQRLPRHARGGAPAGRRHDGHGGAGPAGGRRALRARAVRGVGGDEPDDGHGRRLRRLRVLGTEVEISTPDTKTFTDAGEIAGAYPATPHAVRTATVTICGEPARLVQLVPNAFVVRMSSALDDLGSELAAAATPSGGSATASATAPAKPSLAGIPVRVWAELGRARMPSGTCRGPARGRSRRARPPGPTTPIDLYVNGTLLRHRPPGRGGRHGLGRAHRARARQDQEQC